MADIPTLVETSDPPLSTDSDAQFDAKAFPWAASLDPFGQSVSAIAIAARDNAEEALAAAVAAAAGSLDASERAGFAGQVLGVDDSTGYPITGFEFLELVTPATYDALTAGDVLYWDGTTLDRLPKGTEGQVLTQGASDAPEWGGPVKAWVNFDGTGTVSIRESFNVSSITDNGAGDYTLNFETAMVDSNYVLTGQGVANAGSAAALFAIVREPSDILTGSVRIRTGYVVSDDAAFADRGQVHVSIFR